MKIGAGPVSFGVYQPSAGGPAPNHLMDAMAAAGYRGAELPPAGYAGPPGAAVELFARSGLTPVGIYIPIHFSDPTLLTRDQVGMEDALSELEKAEDGPRIAILADEGGGILLRNPARGDDPTHALDAAGFGALTDEVNRIAEYIRGRGLTPSFHPHISTYVESPAEVERLLGATDIDLTFDTGHIALGGGDIAECFESWRERINHIHLKDVRHDVLEEAKRRRRIDFDVWWAEVSVPLGEGDLPLREFLANLSAINYQGWAVIEQDRAPISSEAELCSAAEVQRRNLQWVSRVLEGLAGGS
ncbi:MAG: TIM barrel protein [Acidimicrobiia bacterium]|nr:TIM barrel protein [Acidimicrobiia bacterium]